MLREKAFEIGWLWMVLEMVIDSIKLIFIVLLFSFPFYSISLFWGIEYGEFVGLGISFGLSVIIAFLSRLSFFHILQSKKIIKNRDVLGRINNISFLLGMKKVNAYESNRDGLCISFYKGCMGENFLFLDSKKMQKLNDRELEQVIRLYLLFLKNTSSIRSLGVLFIFIMGKPLHLISKLKIFSVFSHFFFIPLKTLSRALYSTNRLKQTIVGTNFTESEIVYLESGLSKLSKLEEHRLSIFSEQVLEGLTILPHKADTLYDLIMNTDDLGSKALPPGVHLKS